MNRVLPAIALIAGLSLTGCSGNDSQNGRGGGADKGSAAQPTAGETPQDTQLDEDQLKQIIESADVDGRSFKTINIGATSGSEAPEDAEFGPAECKKLTMAALNSPETIKGTTVAGISSDNTVSVALINLSDEDAADSQLKSSTEIAEVCKDVKIKSQGIEMTMSHETFDATAAGADETVGVRATINAGNQMVLNTDTVTSRIGNTIVAAANIGNSGDEEAVLRTVESFVDAVNGAG